MSLEQLGDKAHKVLPGVPLTALLGYRIIELWGGTILRPFYDDSKALEIANIFGAALSAIVVFILALGCLVVSEFLNSVAFLLLTTANKATTKRWVSVLLLPFNIGRTLDTFTHGSDSLTVGIRKQVTYYALAISFLVGSYLDVTVFKDGIYTKHVCVLSIMGAVFVILYARFLLFLSQLPDIEERK